METSWELLHVPAIGFPLISPPSPGVRLGILAIVADR